MPADEDIQGAATGALANAGAAAELADAPPELESVEGGEDALTVTLTRAADGSLGLTVMCDDEGRPVVTAGRGDVRAGDIILAFDGTEMFSHSQYEQELRIRAQQMAEREARAQRRTEQKAQRSDARENSCRPWCASG